jgi:transcriptional regulator with XRE-family HTH domain
MNAADILIRKARARRSLPSPAVCRDLRLGAGITQAEIAEVLGVDRASVTRWESGTREPRGDVRLAYIDLLARLAREATTA